MPTYVVYIYSPSDFVGGLPNESGAQAAGSPDFELTLTADATPTVIEISDDDLIFDEVDGSQVLTQTVTIDGTTYPAGTSLNTAYDLLNSSTGHKVTSVHFGGDGYQQGAVDGLVSSVPLQAGETYTFDSERTSHQKNNPYDQYVACFAAGTRIATPNGPRPVETLRPGDLVVTADHGVQPVSWVGQRVVDGTGAFAPIRLPKGWNGLVRDLWVSPQHRMVVSGAQCELVCGMAEAFASAAHLARVGIGTVEPVLQVTYCHVMCSQHEVLFAEGAPTESLLANHRSLTGFTSDAVAELLTLFPELKDEGMELSRPLLRWHETALVA